MAESPTVTDPGAAMKKLQKRQKEFQSKDSNALDDTDLAEALSVFSGKSDEPPGPVSGIASVGQAFEAREKRTAAKKAEAAKIAYDRELMDRVRQLTGGSK